ncbi:MAG: PTS sugar transporter subunit IIA, partial [Spirochaetaceae bacterium]|nr:PTS sugar transporter subunit IIA [Spirochaetaceae bacterium]
APALLDLVLNIPGAGTKTARGEEDSVSAVWNFESDEIAGLVTTTLLGNLKGEGFYVQMMNIDDGISQARKNDVSLSITESGSSVTIVTSKTDMAYVKTAVYEVIIELRRQIQELAAFSDSGALRKEIAGLTGGVDFDVLSIIDTRCIILDLKGTTKEAVITELVQILAYKGKIDDFDLVLQSVLSREEIVSTGMEHGVAIPHAKTDGVRETVAAVGIQKEGVDFQSVDGEKSRIFILVVSPQKHHDNHLRFLLSISSCLKDPARREKLIAAPTQEAAAAVLRNE